MNESIETKTDVRVDPLAAPGLTNTVGEATALVDKNVIPEVLPVKDIPAVEIVEKDIKDCPVVDVVNDEVFKPVEVTTTNLNVKPIIHDSVCPTCGQDVRTVTEVLTAPLPLEVVDAEAVDTKL